MNVLSFCAALNQRPLPIQSLILKMAVGEPLEVKDSNLSVPRYGSSHDFTESSFVEWLHELDQTNYFESSTLFPFRVYSGRCVGLTWAMQRLILFRAYMRLLHGNARWPLLYQAVSGQLDLAFTEFEGQRFPLPGGVFRVQRRGQGLDIYLGNDVQRVFFLRPGEVPRGFSGSPLFQDVPAMEDRHHAYAASHLGEYYQFGSIFTAANPSTLSAPGLFLMLDVEVVALHPHHSLILLG